MSLDGISQSDLSKTRGLIVFSLPVTDIKVMNTEQPSLSHEEREGKLYQDKSRSHFIALEIALMESEVSLHTPETKTR